MQAFYFGRARAYEKSIEILEKAFFFVGITERFDESLVILKRLLRQRGLMFDMRYVPLNPTVEVAGEVEPEEEIAQIYGDFVLGENPIDTALYNKANTLLDEAIKAYGSSFSNDLVIFRAEYDAYRQSLTRQYRNVRRRIRHRLRRIRNPERNFRHVYCGL